MKILRLLLVLATAPFAACTTSGTITPSQPDGGVVIDANAPLPDAAVPPTWACAGDATTCIQGRVDAGSFTTPLVGGVVELFRVFPAGGVRSVQAQPLAMDDTFAFSGLAPWAHYYVKVTAHFGTTQATATSVGALAGRFAVPSAGTPVTVAVIPVQLELLETGAGAQRQLQWVSAHVFDPTTGLEQNAQSAGAVMFSANGIAAMPMGFVAGDGGPGAQRFYLAFSPAHAAATGYQVTAQGHAWSIATEADFAGALSSPADGASVPAGQPLVVTWPMQAEADYMSVDLFSRTGSQFTGAFDSGDPIAPDVTTLTIPGGSVPAGTLLLNVNAARAACRLQSDGCAYLLEAGSANLTAH
jgi:hypothetical protein